ncbi:hypothetical protein BS78_06G023600 [Paspalum vaginatum]|nr:hypothetical protein BS78_06G023600 [Paspalum vaginatum]
MKPNCITPAPSPQRTNCRCCVPTSLPHCRHPVHTGSGALPSTAAFPTLLAA